jgi:hypothetical protein
MPDTPPPGLKKLLLIPEGTDANQVRDKVEQAFASNDRLPAHTLKLGEVQHQGEVSFRPLSIEFESAGSVANTMDLRRAVDLTLQLNDLSKYSPTTVDLGGRARA